MATPRPRCSAPTDRPDTWLAGTGRPPQRTGWSRASSRPSRFPSSSSTRSSSTRVRATERSMLTLVVESPNARASWTIRARCSSGRAIRYLRVTRQPSSLSATTLSILADRASRIRYGRRTARKPAGNTAAVPTGRAGYDSDAERGTALDSGDTAFVLISAALVMFMIPGLALFYGGMVRAKNVLATVMQSFFTMGLVSVLWVLAAYSLAFAPGEPLHRRPRLPRLRRRRPGAQPRPVRRPSPTSPTPSSSCSSPPSPRP